MIFSLFRDSIRQLAKTMGSFHVKFQLKLG